MTWGFELGRTYNRRADIHSRFGGQQQGGIITPASYPIVVIITGEEGLEHGYADRYRPDGAFEYFGEGQTGDMELQRGNAAIERHSENGKSLLLFRKTNAGLRFEGEMVCEGYHTERAPDRNGNERDAIVFELRPLDAIAEAVQETKPAQASLDELRKRALEAGAIPNAASATAKRTVYQRSRDVRDYVLARANGHCEGCQNPAPFMRADGTPYLEPHHTTRVSDGGPDHPAHVIALCPNCHRRVHAGADGVTYNGQLVAVIASIEAA
jgi:5-methylcytosine-specific restriction protein A